MQRPLSIALAVLVLIGVSAAPAAAAANDVVHTPVCYRTESTAPATITFVVDLVHPDSTFTATQRSDFRWLDASEDIPSVQPIVAAHEPDVFPADTTVRGWATVTPPDDHFDSIDQLWWTVNSHDVKMQFQEFQRECADDEPGLPPAGGGSGESDGSEVDVVPDCYYRAAAEPKTGEPVQYVLAATNKGSAGPEFDTAFAWSDAPPDTLDVNINPTSFPPDTPVKAVATVVPDVATVNPAGELTWTIGSTDNVFQASQFTTVCAEEPLPGSGSSAVAVLVISMLVPVALMGGYLLYSRRRRY